MGGVVGTYIIWEESCKFQASRLMFFLFANLKAELVAGQKISPPFLDFI